MTLLFQSDVPNSLNFGICIVFTIKGHKYSKYFAESPKAKRQKLYVNLFVNVIQQAQSVSFAKSGNCSPFTDEICHEKIMFLKLTLYKINCEFVLLVSRPFFGGVSSWRCSADIHM